LGSQEEEEKEGRQVLAWLASREMKERHTYACCFVPSLPPLEDTPRFENAALDRGEDLGREEEEEEEEEEGREGGREA